MKTSQKTVGAVAAFSTQAWPLAEIFEGGPLTKIQEWFPWWGQVITYFPAEETAEGIDELG